MLPLPSLPLGSLSDVVLVPARGAHSLQGRCCWRRRSQRHRCGRYRAAGGHRGCDRHSGRWCSGQRGPRQPLLQGTCLLPQSRSCSPWSGQSVREGRAGTGMLCAQVSPAGFPSQGSQQLLCAGSPNKEETAPSQLPGGLHIQSLVSMFLLLCLPPSSWKHPTQLKTS